MIINILTSQTLFSATSWSISQLLPKENIKLNSDFKFIKLKELVRERHKEKRNDESEYINYIGLENIESKTGRLINFEMKKKESIKSGFKTFFKGDILFGRLRPNLNKIYLNNQFNIGGCTTEIIVLQPNSQIVDSIYLVELLRTEKINKQIVNLIKGAALPRVNINDLLEMEIPLPNLELQTKISREIIKKRQELEELYKKIKLIPEEIDDLYSCSYAS